MLHAWAEPFANYLPVQIAIIELEDGSRPTVRSKGDPVKIGDSVRTVEERDGVCWFGADRSTDLVRGGFRPA